MVDEGVVLAIDLGTESLRAGLFDLEGREVAAASAPYPVYFPRPGWAEQEADDWWTATRSAVASCLAMSPVQPDAVKGIAVGATACTVVPVDAHGRPLRRAILWMDGRAVDEVELISRTAHPVLRYAGGEDAVEWMVPKALWLKRHEASLYREATHIVEALDWLTFKLTGRWTASLDNVSNAWNYVPALGGWVPEFYQQIGLADVMTRWPADVLAIGAVAGRLTAGAADELGLSEGVIVGEGTIDAHMGMIGLNALRPGQVALIIGSSTVQLTLAEEPAFSPGIWGPFEHAVVPGLWLLEGGQISTGSTIRWFAGQLGDGQGGGPDLAALDREAAATPPGAEGLIALDHWQGCRTPARDPLARGAILGLSLKHTRGHLFRAILEASAFGTRLMLETFAACGAPPREVRVTGGGIGSDLWLQIHADVCQLPLTLTDAGEDACVRGGAICAAVACGAYRDLAEAANAMVRTARRVEPVAASADVYDFYYRRYQESYHALAGTVHALVQHLQ